MSVTAEQAARERAAARAAGRLPAARQVNRAFAEGSEAELLIRYRAQRLASRSSLDQVMLRGEPIDISYVPPELMAAYRVNDVAARRLGIRSGDVIAESQISSMHGAAVDGEEDLGEYIMANSERIANHVLSPDFYPRSLSGEEDDYIRDLQRRIDAAIVPPLGAINTNTLQGSMGQHVASLLSAISNDNERDFINNTVWIVAMLNANRSQSAAQAFKQAFATLFVIKEFPSAGICRRYLHNFLRCGVNT